jgi:LuxR family transcriptional regulator, maltose regulon positive regulatory protein
MSTAILATKLFIPPTGKSLVVRPRLMEKLEGCLQPGCRLTLVSAPPGFGKTTLISTWVSNLKSTGNRPSPLIAWLSLDDWDNDSVIFWTYFISALQTTQKAIGKQALNLLEAASPLNLEATLTSLINDLVQLSAPLVLILDDYHLIRDPETHKFLSSFIEHAPPDFHLVILSRTDPPLPLALLRGRGQLLELRLADLRFSNTEAAEYLNEGLKLALPEKELDALNTKTEGWAAGLQMAALSMQGRQDASQFIESFSGSNRYILDYLLEQVLDRQKEDVKEFLLRTSILESLCGPLCDAVLEVSSNSQAFLEFLERANLFLLPQDKERHWYRYHHLFADLLRARLKQSQPDLIPQLLLRASAWYEQNGLPVEAIQHSLSAKDYEHAADLIERYGPARWSQNDTIIMMLVRNLPQVLLKMHPKLGIYQAWILVGSGQTQAAISLLSYLKEQIQWDAPNPSTTWMRAFIDLLFAYTAHPRDGTNQEPWPDLHAFDSMPEEDTGLHNIADFLCAMLLGRHGELDLPAEILLHCVQRDALAGGTTAIPLAIPLLARIRLMQGRLHEAADLCRDYLKPINKRGTRFFYIAGSFNIILGEVLREWNQLDKAEAQIREGIKVNEPWQIIAVDALGYSALARVQEAKGNINGAIATMCSLEAMFEERTKPSDWEGELRSLKVRLWLATGDLARAVDWARHFPQQQSPGPLQETDQLTVARIRMAEKNYREVQQILEALNQAPGIEKRVNRKVKINLLMACALAGQNQMPQAFQLLETSLSMAEPEGLIRVFLDMGQPMQMLLAQWLAHAKADPLRDYAIHLLSQFDAEPHGIMAAQENVSPSSNLVEPLSKRELEVLQLIAVGGTNQEIAQQLIVSRGTVKAHTASIYRKLDVANRTEAVARARQLGILP